MRFKAKPTMAFACSIRGPSGPPSMSRNRSGRTRPGGVFNRARRMWRALSAPCERGDPMLMAQCGIWSCVATCMAAIMSFRPMTTNDNVGTAVGGAIVGVADVFDDIGIADAVGTIALRAPWVLQAP